MKVVPPRCVSSNTMPTRAKVQEVLTQQEVITDQMIANIAIVCCPPDTATLVQTKPRVLCWDLLAWGRSESSPRNGG